MSGDREHTKAAALFTGILAVCAGFTGLAVAGIVLGFDWMLHGDRDERQDVAARRAENRRNRYQDAIDWLDADRADRARYRSAVRDWFRDDPATRGDRPSSAETLGRALGRAWRSLLVGATRFARGWRTGREEARRRRATGDDRWWWHRESRDTVDTEPPPEPQPAGPPNTDTGPTPRPEPQPSGGPAPDDDVIDAEVVPNATDSDERTLEPVGVDRAPADDSAMAGYAQRLKELEAEVVQARGDTRPRR